MAGQSGAQRQWRSVVKQPRRSTRVMLASSVLILEAFVVFFATLVIFGLRSQQLPASAVLSGGMTLSLLLVLACPLLRKHWGIWFGWVLQLLLIALGLLEPMMFIVGPLFAIAWWYALHLGRRIDRENAERDVVQDRWEREHPAAG